MQQLRISWGIAVVLLLALIPGVARAVGNISGTVTDATGNPLSSAYVQLRQPGTNTSYYDYADGSGNYEITSVPAGNYWVRADVANRGLLGQYYGGVTFESENPTFVTVTDGNTTTGIDIVCPDGFSISGTITDENTASPLDNVYVGAFRRTGESLWWGPYTYTNSSGLYHMSGLPPGPVSLSYSLDGYIDEYYDNKREYNAADVLTLDGISNITGADVELRRGGTILVAVMDPHGLPPHNPGTTTILDNAINDMAADPSGNLWFATDLGVMGIVSGVTQGWQPYNSDLPAEIVNALSIDGSGNRYYATEGGFVRHNTDDSMDVFTMDNSTLYSDECTAVVAGVGAHTYIGSDEGTLFRYNGVSTFTDFDPVVRGEPSSTSITGLAYRSNVNKLYIGTGTGLTVYDIGTNSFSRITSSSGLPSNSVLCVDAAGDGTLWAGTSSGIYVIAPGGTVSTYTTADGLPSNYIQDIHVLNSNRAWVATNSGIALFDTGVFTSYNTADGLSSNSRSSIYESGGKAYAGTTYDGFDIFEGGSFRQVEKNYLYFSVAAKNTLTEDTGSGSTNRIAFSIEGLPTGEYVLYLNNYNFPRKYYDNVYQESLATAIAVTEGATTAQRYVLVVDEYGGISGAATDSGGSPLSSGTVKFHPVGDFFNTTSTSVSGGSYSNSSLTPGEYYVSLYSGSNASVFYPGVLKRSDADIVTVTPGTITTGIDLQLQATTDGSLAGRVVDQNGDPYPFVSVRVEEAVNTSNSFNLTTDSNGYYATTLRPGIYTVSADPLSLPTVYHASTFYEDQADIAEVGDNENVTGINVTVPNFTPGTISGIVLDGGGNPLDGVEILVYADINYPMVQTQPDGTFQVHNLAPQEEYYVQADKTSYTRGTAGPLYLASGDNIGPVTLTLESYTPATVSGVVRDASGNRLWDTYVYLRHLDLNVNEYLYTNWDGSFTFSDFPEGDVRLEVIQSGFDSALEDFALVAGANTRDVTLTYSNTSGAIWGRVLDDNGIARPGIRVRLTGSGTYYEYTNRDGVFVFPGLSTATYSLEGYTYEDNDTPVSGISVSAGSVQGPIDIEYDLTFGTILGHVTRQSDGQPVSSFDAYTPGSSSYTYEGANGAYAICGLLPGNYQVRVEADGYVIEYYNNALIEDTAQNIHIAGSEDETGIDFALAMGASISGQVVDGYNRPLENARVEVRDLVTNRDREGNTDLNGHYTVSGIRAGSHRAFATRYQYYTTWFDNKGTGNTADILNIASGSSTPGVDFVIGAGGAVSGTVADASGNPYTSGTVYAYDARDLSQSFTSANLDGSGNYELTGLRPVEHYLLANVSGRPPVFYDGAYAAASAQPVLPVEGSTQTGIDFVVPQSAASGSISGTITRETGDPYGSITVRALGVDGYSGSYSDSTDGSGDYEITGLQPGSYVVYIQESNCPNYHYGGTYDQDAATRVEITPGSAVTGINIQAPVKPYATVRGVVRTGGGTPVSDVNVELSSAFAYRTTRSNSSGEYAFAGVFPDPDYTLRADKPGYYNYEQTNLNIPDNGDVVVDITMTAYAPCVAYGKVLNASGQPLRYVSVTFEGQDVDYSVSMDTDMFGDYYFPNLPAGTYQARASEYPFNNTSVTGIVLSPATPVETDIVMEPYSGRGTIAGRVTDAAGNPVRGVLMRASGPLTVTQHTQADGTYQIRSLTPGTYTVSAYQENDSGNPSQSGVTVTDGGFTDGIDFALSVYYGTISGIIRDATGAGIYDAYVNPSPYSHSYYPSSVRSGTQGLYIVERVRTDGGLNYTLYADKTDYVTTWYDGAFTSSLATQVMLNQGASAGGIDITLADGGGFSGTVTDARTGLPVSGTVYADGDVDDSANANSSGYYRLSSLPPGEYALRFSASGYTTEYYNNVHYGDEATPLTIGSGEVLDGIDFSPSEGARISGTIADASGNPLTGRAYAYQARRTSDDAFSDYTNDGNFVIENLVEGNYYVYASVSGKPIVYYDGAYGKGEATLVAAQAGQETTGINLVLPVTVENGSISGRITKANGAPYGGVRVYYTGVDGTSGSSSTTTDSDGNYTLANRTPGTYLVSARETNTPDYYYPGTFSPGAATKIILEPGEAVTGIDIQTTQPPTARVEGVVRNPASQPVAGVEVQLGLSPVSYSTRTRSDGSYAFPNVFPQNGYILSAEKSGYFPYEQTGVNVPQDQTTVANITLTGYSSSIAYGKITNASGNALDDVYVQFDGTNVDYSTYQYTDYFGDYTFTDLPPGTYRITCSMSGYTSETMTGVVVGPGSPAVNDFVLDWENNYGVVAGRVIDSEGNPVPGVYVRSNNGRTTNTGRDGTYQLTRLSAGTYTISLPSEDDSGDPSVSGVTVVANQITPGVDFALSVPYGTISGVITSKSGTPLPGVDIDGDAVNTSPSPGNVTSGTSGYYLLTRVRTDGGRDYTVRASLSGYAETYYDGDFTAAKARIVHLDQGGSATNINIALPPGAGFEGTVIDARSGLPVTTGTVYADGDRTFSVGVDDAGYYHFDNLPPGPYTLRHQATDYVREYFRESPWQEFALELTLSEGQIWSGIHFTPEKEGTISGVVADNSGTPYTSGTVYAYSVIQGWEYYKSDGMNSSGEYEINGLPAGDYYVAAKVSGKPTVYYPSTYNSATATQVNVDNEETVSGINITVPQSTPDGTISGRVLKQGGAPYASIAVRAYQLDADTSSFYASTDSDGAFTISNVKPGVYAVGAIETDAPPFYWGGTYDRAAANRVVLNPGANVTGAIITIRNVNYATVSGVVRDNAGNPVDGADLELDAEWSDYDETSGYDGSFRFTGVFPDTGYALTAEKPGYFPASQTFDLAAGENRGNVILVLTPYSAGTLAGRVRDASGIPITSANVTIVKADESYTETAYTDDHGEYVFASVPQGNYRMTVSRTGYNTETVNNLPIPVDTTTVRNFVMTPVTFRGRVTGRVFDSAGNPVIDARVRSEGPYTRTAYTSVDGTYILDYLTAGTYRIYLPDEPGPGNERTGVTVVAGQDTHHVNFYLSVAYGTISGTVRDVTGTGLQGLTVEARRFDGTGSTYTMDTNLSGVYHIGRLPVDATGGFRVWCDEQPYAPAYWNNTSLYGQATAVTLNASNLANNINLTMQQGGSLRGRVVDTSGQPINDVYVRARLQADTNPSFTDNTANSGWYAIDGLPAGNYTLYFSKSGYFAEYHDDVRNSGDATEFSVAAGDLLQINADLKQTSTISGIVRSATGGPVKNARVYIRNLRNTYNTSRTTDSSGAYEFTGLENGNYYLWASKSGYLTVYYDGRETEAEADLVVLQIGATESVDFTLTAYPAADYDEDGDVDEKDITEFYKMLSTSDGRADINGDGNIDFHDAMEFAKYWAP